MNKALVSFFIALTAGGVVGVGVTFPALFLGVATGTMDTARHMFFLVAVPVAMAVFAFRMFFASRRAKRTSL
jgi:hypothetical protein